MPIHENVDVFLLFFVLKARLRGMSGEMRTFIIEDGHQRNLTRENANFRN